MPIDREFYPDNWNEIVLTIKAEAGWTCQECDRPCRKVGESLQQFVDRYVEQSWQNQSRADILKSPKQWVLTVAHLDQTLETMPGLTSRHSVASAI